MIWCRDLKSVFQIAICFENFGLSKHNPLRIKYVTSWAWNFLIQPSTWNKGRQKSPLMCRAKILLAKIKNLHSFDIILFLKFEKGSRNIKLQNFNNSFKKYLSWNEQNKKFWKWKKSDLQLARSRGWILLTLSGGL